MHTHKQLVQSLFEKFPLPAAVSVFDCFDSSAWQWYLLLLRLQLTLPRKKSSEKVSAWMVFIFYFSAFFSWWWQAQLHIWSRSVYEKSVFVFFIEDLKCKYALSLTATDSLSFILFPVSVLRCIMWAVRFCDLILELKLYCLQNIFHTPANRLWRSNA